MELGEPRLELTVAGLLGDQEQWPPLDVLVHSPEVLPEDPEADELDAPSTSTAAVTDVQPEIVLWVKKCAPIAYAR